MWFFRSPEIVFGEGALDHLTRIQGRKAFIVTDETMVTLGFVEQVQAKLAEAGIETAVFAEVKPNPTFQVVRRGAALCAEYEPDWIVGLGGGSPMDAAKAIYVLYERPDLEPADINPVMPLGLERKASLLTISTTAGTGAEATWPIVLTDEVAQRKSYLGSSENMADLAIVDPSFTANLPRPITADTGMDALTHAIEGYTVTWHNDFCDGLCLMAIKLTFDCLPRAVADGADQEAREKMHNAASIAGLGFGNALAAMAHAMGHSLGAVFHIPHGRCVGVVLPYTIEFIGEMAADRFADIARFSGIDGASSEKAPQLLAGAIRDLSREIGQPLSLQEMGIQAQQFEAALPKLVENAECDACLVVSPRIPDSAELERLYRHVFEGKPVDF